MDDLKFGLTKALEDMDGEVGHCSIHVNLWEAQGRICMSMEPFKDVNTMVLEETQKTLESWGICLNRYYGFETCVP